MKMQHKPNKLEELLDEIYSLKQFISKIIARHKINNDKVFEWQRPESCKTIVDNLDYIYKTYKHDAVKLAKSVISIDRDIDYFSFDWAKESDQQILRRNILDIVTLAQQIFVSVKFQFARDCGRHEDTACIFGNLSPNFSNQVPSGLNKEVAESFWAPFIMQNQLINCAYLPLIRVIGKMNSPYGSYWLIGSLPRNIKMWRSNYAVLSCWNKGTQFVELQLPRNKITKNNYCWLGYAASKQVTGQICILHGGSHQVWIPPDIMKFLKKNVSNPIPTGW